MRAALLTTATQIPRRNPNSRKRSSVRNFATHPLRSAVRLGQPSKGPYRATLTRPPQLATGSGNSEIVLNSARIALVKDWRPLQLDGHDLLNARLHGGTELKQIVLATGTFPCDLSGPLRQNQNRGPMALPAHARDGRPFYLRRIDGRLTNDWNTSQLSHRNLTQNSLGHRPLDSQYGSVSEQHGSSFFRNTGGHVVFHTGPSPTPRRHQATCPDVFGSGPYR